MKKNRWGAVLVIFAVLLIASGALVTCAMVFVPSPVHKSVTLEAGVSEIPMDLFSVVDKQVTLLSDIKDIDLNKPGTYTLEFSYKDKTYSSVLQIVDTTAPTGKTKGYTIYNDETLSAEDFVVEINDFSAVTVSFGVEPDFTKVGQQTVVIHLTDTSDNVGVVTAQLNVIADTSFPVFSEMEELKVNLGQSVSYRKNITATDDRDGELAFTIDSSDVNLEEEGAYIIKYEATDSSGNTTTVERKIHVMSELVVNQELVDELAQEILDKIFTDDMTPHEKIKAIYFHVRRNVSYSHSSETDYLKAAYDAMTKRRGDCYNYFAYAKVLLDLAGIDNIPVERYKGRSSHFWLLVNLGTGWYHYDASPQSEDDPFRCFMKTDAQVQAYANSRSDGRDDYYDIDYSKYPELAKEKYSAS